MPVGKSKFFFENIVNTIYYKIVFDKVDLTFDLSVAK